MEGGFELRCKPFRGHKMIVIIRPCYYDYYCYQSQCQADEKSKEIKKNQEQ